MHPRIAVIGDTCVDKYWIGDDQGISAEAPVPVIRGTVTRDFPGMAGNVVKLLEDLGGVDISLLISPVGNVPVKNRLMSLQRSPVDNDITGATQIARWDERDWCNPLTMEELLRLEENLPIPTAFIICDYGKGAISPQICSRLLQYADAGIPLFVDTKGDPFRWIGAPVTLFPNNPEYLRWHSHYDWMQSVVHKMGERGMEYLRYGKQRGGFKSIATRVQNVCGAGDAVIAAFTWAAVRGYDIEGALAIATDAAASLVERPFWDRRITLSEAHQKASGGI